MDKMFVITLALFLGGLLIGNHDGDQSTLRDCATTGRAKMLGGGIIKCEVLKEQSNG